MRPTVTVCLFLLAGPLAAQDFPAICREPQPSTFVEPGLLGSVERSTQILGERIKAAAEGKTGPRAAFRDWADRFEDNRALRNLLTDAVRDALGRAPTAADWAQALTALRQVRHVYRLPDDRTVLTGRAEPAGLAGVWASAIVVRADPDRFPQTPNAIATLFLANALHAVLIAMGEDPSRDEVEAIYEHAHAVWHGTDVMCR